MTIVARDAETGRTLALPPALKEQQKLAFLEALRELGTVRAACEATGISRATPYIWRDADPAFVVAWSAALEDCADTFEGELFRRAREERGMPGVIATLAALKRFRPQHYAAPERQASDATVDRLATSLASIADSLRANRATLDALAPPAPPAPPALPAADASHDTDA